MLLKSSSPVERNGWRGFGLMSGFAILSVAALASDANRSIAFDAESPKKDAKDSTNPKAEKPAATPKQNPLAEELKQLGISIDPGEVQLFLGSPDDETLKELQEQQLQILRQLQNLLGDPGLMQALPSGLPNPGLHRRGANPGQQLRLGVTVSQPSPTLVDQLELPQGQGLALDEVRADSVAAKSGLKSHDILLELDGKPVSSDFNEFARQLATIPADKSVDALILRRGRRETLKGLKLPAAKAAPAGQGPGLNGFGGFQLVPRIPGRLGGNVPGFGGGFGFGALAGQNVGRDRRPGNGADNAMSPSVTRNGDNFTVRHQDGDLAITVTGKVAEGRVTVSEIQVKDGRESNTFSSMEKVPEAYREKAKLLADLIDKDSTR